MRMILMMRICFCLEIDRWTVEWNWIPHALMMNGERSLALWTLDLENWIDDCTIKIGTRQLALPLALALPSTLVLAVALALTLTSIFVGQWFPIQSFDSVAGICVSEYHCGANLGGLCHKRSTLACLGTY